MQCINPFKANFGVFDFVRSMNTLNKANTTNYLLGIPTLGIHNILESEARLCHLLL